MKTWGIVPVKNLAQSKRRLAAVLAPTGRLQLSRDMLIRTVRVLQSVQGLTDIVVVSRDPTVLEMARRQGARPLEEREPVGLNPALLQATQIAADARVDALLILPIDLPLVEPTDLDGVLALIRAPAGGERSVLIAPDRRGEGTNLLALRPPGIIRYQYGPGSFWRHRSQCLELGIPFHTAHHPHLALDIDLPADLELLESANRQLC